MILRVLLFLFCTATSVLADVKFTSPGAGTTEAGGTALSIKWSDSGDDPSLDDLVSYQLFLCAGGNDEAQYVSRTEHLSTRYPFHCLMSISTDPIVDPRGTR